MKYTAQDLLNDDMRIESKKLATACKTAARMLRYSGDTNVKQISDDLESLRKDFIANLAFPALVMVFADKLEELEVTIEDIEHFQADASCKLIIDYLRDELEDGKYVLQEYNLEKMRTGA